MTWCWIDGEITPAHEARVAALDHGLTVGDGVFETLKVVEGEPFALTRHLRRLRRSAAALGLPLPLDDAALRTAIAELTAAADAGGEPPRRLRITLTAGQGPLGSERGGASPSVVLAAATAQAWPPTADVATVPWTRNENGALAGIKSTSYAENVRALAAARERGASEAILANTRGALCEGTGTNVFLALDGRLLTPSLASGCLAGITRELVMECVEVVESDALTLDDLRGADEAFLTSSTRDVQPIARVDDRAMPSPCPGPLTERAAAALAALQARTLDP